LREAVVDRIKEGHYGRGTQPIPVMHKFILFALVLCALSACSSTPKSKPTAKPKTTFSSFDPVEAGGRSYGRDEVNLKNIEITQFLVIYQEFSGRTIIRPANLPGITISLRNQQPKTTVEMLQLFDTTLAANNIAMVLVGDNAVKALPAAQATREVGPVINLPAEQLPESGSFMVRTVRLKRVKAVDMIPLLQPLAGLPNSIVASSEPNLLILRDYSTNIRAMLKLIEEVERSR
jgi:type II secretory pathway component GspD/PulD (secretin)